jgi:Putative amidase domain
MFRRCIGGRRWLLSLSVVATLGWTLALTGSASAISAQIQISGTDGEGVLIQSEPNGGSTRLGWMGEGASPEYICFTHGEMVGTVSVWFYVTHEGITGYYPSFYDNSSYQNDAELTAKYGVPLCGSAPEPAPESEPPAKTLPESGPTLSETAPPVVPGVGFNRIAAVGWATSHVENKPPYPASCTWFVSQALWAGGLAKTTAWTSSGGHGHLDWRPGTAAAWSAPVFIKYMLGAYPHSTFTQISLRGNKVPAAEPGDVIAYDWEGKSSVRNYANIEHLSFVTRIASGQYPEVAEWSVYNGTQPTPYIERGWTWSQKTHKWLQQEYPKVQAFLLHINTN